MSVLARWQRTIVDQLGNIVPNCNIEVRREIPGAPLAVLYSDRDGLLADVGNPFAADANGFAAFHVAGGAYRIRAYTTGFDITWRYVAIGTNGEVDFGTTFVPRGAWSGATTYVIGDLVSDDDGSGPYAFVSNVNNNLNHAPPFTTSGVGTSDAYWTVVGLIEAPGAPGTPGSSDVVGTSISNVAIGTGTKNFTIVEADRGWGVGARLRIASDADPINNWMEGIVIDYVGTALQVSVDEISGSGSHSDWTINIAGQKGEAGGIITVYQTPVGGTADAITAVTSSQLLHLFKAASANTGPATYNGRPIKDKDGNALAAGAIQPNIWYLLLDDLTNYYIIMAGVVL